MSTRSSSVSSASGQGRGRGPQSRRSSYSSVSSVSSQIDPETGDLIDKYGNRSNWNRPGNADLADMVRYIPEFGSDKAAARLRTPERFRALHKLVSPRKLKPWEALERNVKIRRSSWNNDLDIDVTDTVTSNRPERGHRPYKGGQQRTQTDIKYPFGVRRHEETDADDDAYEHTISSSLRIPNAGLGSGLSRDGCYSFQHSVPSRASLAARQKRSAPQSPQAAAQK